MWLRAAFTRRPLCLGLFKILWENCLAFWIKKKYHHWTHLYGAASRSPEFRSMTLMFSHLWSRVVVETCECPSENITGKWGELIQMSFEVCLKWKLRQTVKNLKSHSPRSSTEERVASAATLGRKFKCRSRDMWEHGPAAVKLHVY